jgi:hypothetical protein
MNKNMRHKRSLAYAKQLKSTPEGLVTVLLRSPSYHREYERLKGLPHINKEHLEEAYTIVKNSKKRLEPVKEVKQYIRTITPLTERDNSSLLNIINVLNIIK